MADVSNDLWRREPKSDIFVDLLDPSLPYELVYKSQIEGAKHRFRGREYEPEQCNRLSRDFRFAGNREFRDKKWRHAMECYNRSILFADGKTDNLSVAYANRSACFFHMKKYHNCINDIELAKANDYPKHLLNKLIEREIESAKFLVLERANLENVNPKLSFDEDRQFPGMANVLEIRTNQNFGRHIVAKSEIDAGRTVLVERAFVHVFDATDRMLCQTCMRHMQNFIPCLRCTDAMFCGDLCMRSNLVHRFSCGLAYNRIPGIMRYCADSVLIAIRSFPSVEHLMEFVGNQLTLPRTALPTNCSPAQMQYGLFLKSDKITHDTDMYQNIMKYVAYRQLMTIPLVKEKFTTKRKQRFLMHLIWQHKNIGDRSFVRALAEADISNPSDGGNKIFATCNIYGLFNHACVPNVFSDFVGSKRLLITTRPVRKGEQLFVCYDEDLWLKSAVQRKLHLKNIYNFNSKCPWCRDHYILNGAMPTDPLYIRIEQSRGRTLSDAQRRILKKMCYNFMRKYENVPCSHEILVVSVQLMYMLQEDYPEYRKAIN